MRRTTPDLVGSRQSVFRAVSIGLLVLTIAYVLWTNYVVFVGGNLPLTGISLGTGSTGAGLMMLFIGDLIIVLAAWFLIDGLLLNALHALLSTGGRRRSGTAPPQQAQPAQPYQQAQTQPTQTQPAQTQPTQWQQPPQQWQPQQLPPQWSQPQQQWQPSSPPPAAPPGWSGAGQQTMLAPQPDRQPPRER